MSGATQDYLPSKTPLLVWGLIVLFLAGFVGWSFKVSGEVEDRRGQVTANVRSLIALQTDSLDDQHRSHLRSLGFDIETDTRTDIELALRARNGALSKELGSSWSQVGWLLTGSQLLAGLTLLLATVMVVQQVRSANRKTDLAKAKLKEESAADLERMNTKLRTARDGAIAAERMKTRLLQLLGHELRTPITTVRGQIEMLEEEGHPAGPLLESIHKLEMRVAQILDLAEPRTSHPPVQPTSSLIETLGPICIQFEATLECPVDLEIDLHPERLMRIATEVLSNSNRFAGSPSVRCLKEDHSVVIRFEDQGPGMTKTEVERATEPFWQADMRPTRHHRGLGLGLAVARHHAETAGGTLTLFSTPGLGQRVELAMPEASA